MHNNGLVHITSPFFNLDVVRIPGIEPGTIAWEAIILPLNHIRSVH